MSNTQFIYILKEKRSYCIHGKIRTRCRGKREKYAANRKELMEIKILIEELEDKVEISQKIELKDEM